MLTALSLNFRRTQTTSAINNFMSNINFVHNESSISSPLQEDRFNEIYRELLFDYKKLKAKNKKIDKTTELMNTIQILQKKSNSFNMANSFIGKCKKIKTVVLIAMFLGGLVAIFSIYVKQAIDQYLLCYVIWCLGCFSLWITLKVIIKEWEKSQYVEKR